MRAEIAVHGMQFYRWREALVIVKINEHWIKGFGKESKQAKNVQAWKESNPH